ncbi:protein NODULATION SIGNALING PATHWAY 2 [Arachis hypogaea]|nr:Nodulation-signaling pathway 2 protein [Arachis hypogaea]
MCEPYISLPAMNVMACEQFDYSFSPPPMNKLLHEYILQDAFPSQSDDHLLSSPNIIYDDVFDEMLEQEALNGFLHPENPQQPDFDFIGHNVTMAVESELCQENIPIAQEEEMHVSNEEGDAYLMGIQAELMGETSLGDLLLLGAEAVEAQNFVLALDIIERINNNASSSSFLENGDSLLNRLALFFARGLYYKSINAPQVQSDPVSTHNNAFGVFQILQELSPYVKFAHFTANQAIFEATEGSEDVHVIDFDIMEGIQWPPLMMDLAMRKNTCLRVTAVVADQQSVAYVQQTGRRLKEFADSIDFPFAFDQIVMVGEEDLQRVELGHTVIVNCMIHQWMPNRSFPLIKTFLDGVSKLSPRLVVLVEEELFNFARLKSMSFVEFFCEALHHYTALSDSLASSLLGRQKMELTMIEKEVMGQRILDSVKQFPCEREERMVWEEGFYSLKRFKRVAMSSCNVSQAKFLVSLFGGGYWVQSQDSRLALCWKSRPLTSASTWVPATY